MGGGRKEASVPTYLLEGMTQVTQRPPLPLAFHLMPASLKRVSDIVHPNG